MGWAADCGHGLGATSYVMVGVAGARPTNISLSAVHACLWQAQDMLSTHMAPQHIGLHHRDYVWKYLVSGQALAGAAVTEVSKFGPTGKLVFITVFRE